MNAIFITDQTKQNSVSFFLVYVYKDIFYELLMYDVSRHVPIFKTSGYQLKYIRIFYSVSKQIVILGKFLILNSICLFS